MNDTQIQQLARAVIDTEAAAVLALRERIGIDFLHACRFMYDCHGRIVVLGMGKSGHIGEKIAATLASTGSPAFFVHPGEASHGDMGMITGEDVVLALSNSGETTEIITILPLIKRLGVPLIALTGKPDSTLARAADAHIDVSVEKEACPLGLAPTARRAGRGVARTARLHRRRFCPLNVNDIMHGGELTPRVTEDASLSEALLEMTAKGLGMTAIVDNENRVAGIFTDGDLRRVLDHGEVNVREMGVAEAMTRDCQTVTSGRLAVEVLHLMEQHKINALLVVDGNGKLVGALNMHDLLRAGVV